MKNNEKYGLWQYPDVSLWFGHLLSEPTFYKKLYTRCLELARFDYNNYGQNIVRFFQKNEPKL